MKYIFEVDSSDAQRGTTFSEYERGIAKNILEFIEQIYKLCKIAFPDKEFIIQKAPTAPCPRFCEKSENHCEKDFIIIKTNELTYWCQTIYQISHEMTHAAIHYNSSPESKYISWIEETICEAMSLFFLKQTIINWNSIKPQDFGQSYKESISKYLADLLSEEGTNELANIKSIEELKQINETSQSNRSTRKNEMHKLFLCLDNNNIHGLINYRKYILHGTILLDTKKYKTAFHNNSAVAYLCDLQDNVIPRWVAKLNYIKINLIPSKSESIST